mgnify:CR=1 FL=1
MLILGDDLVFIKIKFVIETFTWGMRKIIILLWLNFILAGCAESVALLAPASTAAGGGNLIQSSFTSVASYGIKKQTGKSPIEHAIHFAEKHKAKEKKQKCFDFLEPTTQEFCSILRNKVSDIKIKINKQSKIKNLN